MSIYSESQWGKGFSEEKPLVATACQQSVFSDNLRASSSSTPRYRIVLSSFECPSKICTALMFYNEERNYQGLNGLPSEEIYFSKQRYAA